MLDSPLRVEPLGPSLGEARLDTFVWGGVRADLAVWLDRSGDKIVVRSRVRQEADGVRRRVRVRSVIEDDVPVELDRTVFELHPDRFVELPPAEVDGAARSIELPAVLRRDQPVRPLGEDSQTVTLRFAGRARLRVGGIEAERDALLLRLGDEDGGWDQWMVAGVGEVSLGPANQAPHRWLVAWKAGDNSDLLFAAPRT